MLSDNAQNIFLVVRGKIRTMVCAGQKRSTAKRVSPLVASILLLSASLAGCLQTDDQDDLEETEDNGSGEADPEVPPDSGPIQQSAASWMVGDRCQGTGPSNIGTTTGINHDTIQMEDAALGQPFSAEISSEIAGGSWSILFITLPSLEIVDDYETSADTIEGGVPQEPVLGVVSSCLGLGHEAQIQVSAENRSNLSG